VADPNDLSSLPQADQDAIGTTLISLLAGFRERDAEKLVGIYTSDADWVNAFGSVKKAAMRSSSTFADSFLTTTSTQAQ